MLKIMFAMIFTIQLLFAQQEPSTRKIWLFADSSADTMLQKQLKVFAADSKGLAERDLVVTVLTATSGSTRYLRTMKDRQGFLLQLYGKDGGLKFSTGRPVSLQQLYDIVDAMPMRKEEIKQHRNKKPG